MIGILSVLIIVWLVAGMVVMWRLLPKKSYNPTLLESIIMFPAFWLICMPIAFIIGRFQ